MKHVTSPYQYRAHNSRSTFGKCAATIASLLTIAAILFVGSRDWKSNKSISAALTDVSDIRGIFAKVEEAGSTATAKKAALDHAANDVERSLIEKGTLVRRSTQIASTAPSAPAGLSMEFGAAY